MPTLTFTSGDDTYVASGNQDFTLNFLAGNDTLTVQTNGSAVTATMGDGNDVVSLKSGTTNVTGGAGTDRFEIYASQCQVDAGADADLINIRGGVANVVDAGLGNDRINFYGDAEVDGVEGGDGDDDFFGYGHVLSGFLYGNAGKDYFVGFIGLNANLFGGLGNDVYRADASNPAAFLELSGEGIDAVQVARGRSFSLPANVENISVQGFSGSIGGSADLLGNALNNIINGHANVENLHGYEGNDTLNCKGGDDTADGYGGNDRLDGGGGNDYLQGHDGNDILQGRAGEDSMFGGIGDDLYYVDTLGDFVDESALAGTDLVRVSVNNYALPDFVENGIVFGPTGLFLYGNDLGNILIGGVGADHLIGLAGNDTLKGGVGDDELYGGDDDDIMWGAAGTDFLQGDAGNDVGHGGDDSDTLHGYAGNDTLYGEGGTDSLLGWEGSDTLYGGDAIDYLNGGDGADTLTGGAGFDQFIFYADESTLGSPDTITDFAGLLGSNGDAIDLHWMDADTSTLADDPFHWAAGGVPNNIAGDLWAVFDGVDTVDLYGDVDGDGAADLHIIIAFGPGSTIYPDDVTL